jgi:hypothetical protein
MQTDRPLPKESASLPGVNRSGTRRLLDGQRLAAVFASGLLLLNFPLITLWDLSVLVLGVPAFPAALFLLWALLIAVTGWLAESTKD